jgi:N-acetylneuraminic acid mutarotase
MISWKDSILVFGGNSNEHGVQSFNTTLNSWSVLNAGISPVCLVKTSCILLPKNHVMVVGGNKSIAIFDIQTNSWEKLENTKYDRFGSVLVELNGRFFMIGGKKVTGSEEFHYDTKTWTEVEATPIHRPYVSSALALPGVNFINILRTNFTYKFFVRTLFWQLFFSYMCIEKAA